MGIPRDIYTFWDRRPLPWFVHRCIRTWRQRGWRVHVLSDASPHATAAPGSYASLSPQHRSDWRRVDCIAERGGVWMDATCLALQGPDHWFDMGSSSLQGFAKSFPPASFYHWAGLRAGDVSTELGWDLCMENWAFAAPPRHPTVRRWRDEFARALAMGLDVYCAGQASLSAAQCALLLPYHTQHLCFTKVARRHGTARISLRPSHADGGPLEFTLAELCTARALHPACPFLKFNGERTRRVLKLLHRGECSRSSAFVRLLVEGRSAAL